MILGTEVPWGEEKSMMSRFLPEYFLVVTPMGLMRKVGNGGEEKGLIMNPFLLLFGGELLQFMDWWWLTGYCRCGWMRVR